MKNKLRIVLWWSFWIIYLELIYKVFILKNILTTNTLSVILFSIPWIIIFSIITSIFNEKVNKVLTIILSFTIMLITLAQIVYYNFYNSIFSFLSLTTGTGQVLEFYEMIISVILRVWYIFVLILVPFILFIIFKNKIFNFNRNNYKYMLLFIHTFIKYYKVETNETENG